VPGVLGDVDETLIHHDARVADIAPCREVVAVHHVGTPALVQHLPDLHEHLRIALHRGGGLDGSVAKTTGVFSACYVFKLYVQAADKK
jgi:hypothetical protein